MAERSPSAQKKNVAVRVMNVLVPEYATDGETERWANTVALVDLLDCGKVADTTNCRESGNI